MDISLKTNTEDTVSFSNIEKFDDDSGYAGHLKIASSSFAGSILATFESEPMEVFIRQLDELNRTLKGTAQLKPTYDSWFINFEATATGAIEISGHIEESVNALDFEFRTDQTCLATLLNDFKAWASM